jgi:uncharacterized protein YaaW (UPF0174 family)
MKRIIILCMAFFMSMGLSTLKAQDQKEIGKERKVVNKLSESELNDRSSRAARKEAKKLKKEGWLTTPGALPIDKQLDRAYKMQYEYDENQYPKYIMSDAMSTGQNYDAAKLQALELAKQNLAGQVQTEMAAMIENTVANQQMDAGQAESITKTIAASKNLISQSLGRVIPVTEVYRDSKRNKEVLVRIAYNGDMAKEAARKVIKQELEKKGLELHEQLDKAMGMSN